MNIERRDVLSGDVTDADAPDHVEVTIDDLFIEQYEPMPAIPPATAMAQRPEDPRRWSRFGLFLLSGLALGVGLLLYRRLTA